MNQGLDSQVGQEQNAPAQPQRITNEFPPGMLCSNCYLDEPDSVRGAGFTPWSPAPVGYSMNHFDPMGVQYFGIPAQSQGSVPQVDCEYIRILSILRVHLTPVLLQQGNGIKSLSPKRVL